MSVIVWDGKVLAADKRATWSGLRRRTTKIFKVGEFLCGVAGDFARGYDMVEWLRGGRKAEEFPPGQRDEKTCCNFILIAPGPLIWLYETSPVPLPIDEPRCAIGSGRDYALAAMHLGHSARDAVEVACVFDVGCGDGIDELTF